MQLYNAIICSYDNHTFSGSDMSGDLNYNNPPQKKKKYWSYLLENIMEIIYLYL